MQTRWFLALIALAGLVVGLSPARAQQAPIGQIDGGGAAGVDGGSGGNALALELPAERHGLPVPVAVVFTGGSQVGEAGVGWGVPLSFISLNETVSRQRPRYFNGNHPPDVPNPNHPEDAELLRATLSLGGNASPLVPVDGAGHWRAIVGAQSMEVTGSWSSDVWTVTDGNGLRYHFERLAGLDNPSLWLLTKIDSGHHTTSKVTLEYRIDPRSAGGLDAPELALAAVRYNYDEDGACAKHELQLKYGTPLAAEPDALLGVFVDNGRLRVRTQVLTSITVVARGASCSSAYVVVRRYELRYAPDADTRLPRLVAVDATGRDGTPEAAAAQPVARYVYGRTTMGNDHSGRVLVYGERDPITIPGGHQFLGRLSSATGTGTTPNLTTGALMDLDGDGLIDFLVDRKWHENRDGTLFNGAMDVYAGLSEPPPAVIGRHDTWHSIRHYPRHTNDTAYESVDILTIDMNGDGRLDVVDAKAIGGGYWRIFVNEPDGWRVVDVSMHRVQQQLTERHMGPGYPNMPVGRSVTGAQGVVHACYRVAADHTWEACPDTEPTFTGGQTTRVQWQLRDVNGDGYPDLVADSQLTVQRLIDDDDCLPYVGTPPPPAPPLVPVGSETWCQAGHTTYGYDERNPDGPNRLIVFLNRGGARIATQGMFADWVFLTEAESCSVEEHHEGVQTCGFVELNGDGIPDRIDNVGAGAVASFGTGRGYAQAPGFVLPADYLRVTDSDYEEACEEDEAAVYHSRAVAGYLDINGDGIADYWEYDWAKRGPYAVHLGTGAGFAPPVPLGAPATLSLSASESACDGSKTSTVAGMFDIDGDGRLDYLELEPGSSTARVLSLWEPEARWGAVAAGRLIEVSNGYGATSHLSYRSLKRGAVSGHDVPFPEIMPVASWVERRAGGDGPDLEPTYMGYSGARQWFDHIADRWSFAGYDFTAIVRGKPGPSGVVFGTAVVTENLRPEELTVGYERNLLHGRPRRVSRLAGNLPENPENLVGLDPAGDPRWRGDERYEYEASYQTLAGYQFPADECTSAPQPWETDFLYLSHDDLDPPCRTTGHTYTASVTTRRGEGGPEVTGDDFVETETRMLEVDSLGRPRAVLHLGDTSTDLDDVCELRTYAASVGMWNVRSAVSSVRLVQPVTDGKASSVRCEGDATMVIAGVRFAYDYYPEGQVVIGLPTRDIVERRDVATGELLDEYTTVMRAFDGMSQLARLEQESGAGLTRWTDITGYDDFGLVASRIAMTADDVSATLVTDYEHDPYTLELTGTRGPNGALQHTFFDGFGRATASSLIDPRDGVEMVTGMTTYLGATEVLPDLPPDASTPVVDVIDPLGQRVRTRTWHTAVPLASADVAATEPTPAETWTTTSLDYLGRARFSERQLGADYGAATIVANEVTRDTLGRVTFAADPYAAGSAGTRYGTSYLYDVDGSVMCTIQGRGPQTSPFTSTAAARFSACRNTIYDGFHAVHVHNTPADTEVGSASWGAYTEVTTDARGRVTMKRRLHGGTVLDRMDSSYDRLGNNTSVHRYGQPEAGAIPVVWTTSYDSLGQPLRFEEPATAVRDHLYDRAGNATEIGWMDGATRRAVRSEYDGLGRLLRVVETNDGVENPASVVSYFYDEGSGEPFHHDVGYAAGHLTHAHSATQSVYLGYDPLGRSTFSAWVDHLDRRVERAVVRRLDGEPTEMRLRLPDTGWADEIAAYRYDSAQRLTQVEWRDEVFPSGITLYQAETIDDLGRVRAARYGNGVHQATSYLDADRNEPTSDRLYQPGPTGSYSMSEFVFDANRRLMSRTDAVGWSGRFERSDYRYDPVSRLESAKTLDLIFLGTKIHDEYSYDGLGNVTVLNDLVGTRDFTTVPSVTDPDRLCRVAGAGWPTGKACSFVYDSLGNVTRSPIRPGVNRNISYDNRARMTSMWETVAFIGTRGQAAWTYDPFGAVATLDLWNSMTGDTRTEVRYGDAAGVSDVVVGGSWQKRFERIIPAGGATVLKRGSGEAAVYLYTHADGRGTKVVLDRTGKVVQDLEYHAFGDVRVSSAAPGNIHYQSEQWNGGDLLRDFGVNVLGPRAYEPRIGRFLQRDPLVIPRSSSQAHPYGFAWNDPINGSDPSGLDPMIPDWCMGDECTGGGTAVSLALSAASWIANNWYVGWSGRAGGPSADAPTRKLPRLTDLWTCCSSPSFWDEAWGAARSAVGTAWNGAGWGLGFAADGAAGFINGVSPVQIWDGPAFGHGSAFHGAQAAGAVGALWYDVQAMMIGAAGDGVALVISGGEEAAGGVIAVPSTALAAAGALSASGHLSNLADSYDHFFRNDNAGEWKSRRKFKEGDSGLKDHARRHSSGSPKDYLQRGQENIRKGKMLKGGGKYPDARYWIRRVGPNEYSLTITDRRGQILSIDTWQKGGTAMDLETVLEGLSKSGVTPPKGFFESL